MGMEERAGWGVREAPAHGRPQAPLTPGWGGLRAGPLGQVAPEQEQLATTKPI